MLTDEELLKYSRQIMLPQIDIEGQQKLVNAHIIVLGLGGLGSPVAMYLATSGIGEITLIDDDKVDLSNLQRQIIHHSHSQGQLKVESAKNNLLQLNPDLKINMIDQRLDEKSFGELINGVDVIVDCCDNFATRFMLNRQCFQHHVPLISGAAIRWEGQLTTFLMNGSSPCYRCLYDEDSFTDQTCAQNGIVGPVVGVIGSMQALEVIKVLTQAGDPCMGKLILFDGLDCSFTQIKYQKKSSCPVCYQN